jgi:hypothetical protein
MITVLAVPLSPTNSTALPNCTKHNMHLHTVSNFSTVVKSMEIVVLLYDSKEQKFVRR